MPKETRRWIPVAADAREAETSVKKVVSSDFKAVRKALFDEAATGSTAVHYELGGMWKDSLSFEGIDFDTLSVPEAGRMQAEGAPEIPQEGLFVAVPENADVKGVKVVDKKERELDGEYHILPASKPVLEGIEPEYIPDKEIYESDEPFPGKYVELLGTKHIAGRKVAHVLVYLLQYRPQSKRVTVLESIDLEVIYETLPGMDAGPQKRVLRKSPLEGLILDSNSATEGEKSMLDAGAAPAVDADLTLRSPDLRGEFLIITTDDLKESVEPLVSAKSRDHSVMTVTKEDILAEFPGQSEDERIRDFIKYAVDHWLDPPDWVILAGDVDKIPTHLMDFEIVHPALPAKLASDHFYADLSGDLAPEVVVSRLPASDPADLARLCNLAAAYATQSGEWRRNVLLTAYEDDGYINCADDIADTAGLYFTVSKKYAGDATKQEVKDALNAGALIANYRGHGADTAWSASNGLDAADVGGLDNVNRIPLVFSIACWNAHIDMAGECFGETWIRNEKAVAFLGATRPSFTDPNHDFNRYLFDAIVRHRLTKVGDIVNWAKIKLLLSGSPAKAVRDNTRMYVLLGDPTAGVYFIGNKNSKSLHVSDCRWADRMSSEAREFFPSIQDATALGYKGCYYCLREYRMG